MAVGRIVQMMADARRVVFSQIEPGTQYDQRNNDTCEVIQYILYYCEYISMVWKSMKIRVCYIHVTLPGFQFYVSDNSRAKCCVCK